MRKRSKYRPRGVIPDTLSWIKAGFQKVGSLPKAGVHLKVKNHVALDDIMRGHGTQQSIDELIAAFNIAEALYRLKPELGLDYSPEIRAAQDAIYALGQRFLKTGKILFTGPEMMAVRQGMDIHDAQLDECDVKTMEKAIDLVNTVIMNKMTRRIADEVSG